MLCLCWEHEHWHDTVGLLSADMCMLGEHMHYCIPYVNSYVGVAWPNAWLMGDLSSR